MRKTEKGIVAAPPVPLPQDSAERAFIEVHELIQAAKQKAYHAANTELITLYWQVGEYVSLKIETEGWGKGTIQKLGTYLQKVQPGIRGFSPQNIWRMRQFYQTYQGQAVLSPLVRELPWTHHMIILSRAKREEEREFNTSRFERAVLEPKGVQP